jgi:hypothetical protein
MVADEEKTLTLSRYGDVERRKSSFGLTLHHLKTLFAQSGKDAVIGIAFEELKINGNGRLDRLT